MCAAAAIVAYHFMEARNFTAPEAMDQAQLGRNIAEGRGFTTWYIRPLSIHLLQDKARAKGTDVNDVLRTAHPDLENPPLYPVLLAGLFKALPMKIRHGVAAEPVGLHRLPPEMAIGWLNVGLFILVVVQVYRLGRLVFDPAVAFLAAAVTAGTEQLWRFAYSGLSTMLLMVLVLAVAHLLVVIERGERAEARAGGLRQVLLALLAGLVLGAACLTRYQAGLLLVPAILFLLLFTGGRRGNTYSKCVSPRRAQPISSPKATATMTACGPACTAPANVLPTARRRILWLRSGRKRRSRRCAGWGKSRRAANIRHRQATWRAPSCPPLD
ncbi:MAG: glycosyltransferase family 39 protein, partial [Verrucomicrobiota bacterium]